MNKDQKIYKIMSGRYRLSLCGSSFYIVEPKHKLIARSYEIYDKVYENSYMSGVYIESEIINLLIEHDIWHPNREKEISTLREQIDDKKVDAFKSYLNPKELKNIKLAIYYLNKKMVSLFAEKTKLDHLSCHNVAETARMQWLISHCCYTTSGKRIKPDTYNPEILLSSYLKFTTPNDDIRELARWDGWKSIWSMSKIKNGRLFERDPIDYSKDQASLCSYSIMYDNISEHPEAPDEKVINDDDCLDGWIISQRRKSESNKKQQGIESQITNPKIKQAKEVFFMAKSEEHAENIYDANSETSKSIIKQRQAVINEKGRASDLDFTDVKLEQEIAKSQAVISAMKRQ